MEGLNLEDLNFNTDALNLFDGETGKLDPKQEAGQNPADGVNAAPPSEEENKGTDDNKNPDGEGSSSDDSESGADQSKDNNQVQAGKTADGEEGSNSSSPKLNETEQLYSNLAAEFKAKGVLPELDVDKIRSLKDIEDAIASRVDSQLTERQKFIEDAQKSGAPVSEISVKVETIDKLKAVTPEFIGDENNIEFRRTAIIQDALSKGYTSERAQVMAQRSIDAGTDVEDAKFAVDSLIETEEASLNKIINDAKAKEQGNLDSLKNYIGTTPEVIPGVTLTDSQKDELYNQITTDLGNKDNAFMKAQKKDPIGSRVKIEAIFYLTKGFTDFSIFGQKTETKITQNIENLIRGANFAGNGTVDTNVPDKNSNFKLADLKDLEIE